MKKGLLIAILIVSVFVISHIDALPCNLNVQLVNQDPYPAVPNDYVEVVFQITGVDNPECGLIQFELVNKFPFEIQGNKTKTINGGTYVKDYNSNWIIPYKIFINADAVDSTEDLEARYFSASSGSDATSKKFPIKIEDSLADFELSVKDYSFDTKELTLEILNIADVDIEALTIEIPKQDNVDVRGANRVVVGDLDSNEYTSADFKADLTDGPIKLNLLYTDAIGVRREMAKEVNFDSSYFVKRPDEQSSTSTWYYIIILLIIVLIVWWIIKKRKKKKEQRHIHRRGMAKL